MLGAGVFVVFGPAASYAGSLLPLAVITASSVAYLNAMSIAQLARVVTRPGGAYAYGRHYISKNFGFLAGGAFLLGKLGSVAAIALTVAVYLTPDFSAFTAAVAIGVMTLVNILGIERTALGARILSTITLTFFSFLILTAIFSPTPESPVLEPEPAGVLTAASLIFFALAGYARVATLGDEVDNAPITIPKAIRFSLAIVVLIYVVLSLLLPAKLGFGLAGATAPVADLARQFSPLFGNWVWLFVAIAALGSLLALLAGMARTAAVMAVDSELPKFLSHRNRKGVPWVAEGLIGVLGVLLVLTNGFEFLIGLSSFAVLTYYAIANIAAYRQPAWETKRPRWLNLLGLIGCAILALATPVSSLVMGSVSLATALALRWGLAKRYPGR